MGWTRVDNRREWDLGLLALRAVLEAAVKRGVRDLVPPLPPSGDPVHMQLRPFMEAADDGPSLSAYLASSATVPEWGEFVVHRYACHLKGDPHAWAIPRVNGRTKAALVEIQADEYGGGGRGGCTRRCSPG